MTADTAQTSTALAHEPLALDDRTLEILSRRGKAATVGRRGRLIRRALLLADLVGLALAFAAAVIAFPPEPGQDNPVSVGSELALFVATLPGWVVLARLYGLYGRDEKHMSHTTIDDIIGVFHLVTVGSWILFAGAWLTGLAEPHLPKLILFWILAVLLVVLARVSARAFCRRRRAYLQNTVIVGAGKVGGLIARKFLGHPEYGINLVGFVDRGKAEASPGQSGQRVIGPPERLASIVSELDVERVVIAFSQDSPGDTLTVLRSLQDLDVQIDIAPRLFDAVGPSAEIHTVGGFPLVGLPPLRLSASARFLKRSMDVCLAAVGLVLLAPVLLWIAVRIRLDSKGPICYRHERVGMEGRPFRLLKFRTMHLEYCSGAEYGGDVAHAEFERMLEDPAARAEFETTQKLADDPRVTPFGRFLRRTSLDELPQLVNVLRGDMSLVGARPITRAELSRYGREKGTLLRLRPGITGYWQINGRSGTSYDERVRLDIAYVLGWSLRLDALIIGKTIRVLLKGQGAY